METVTPPALRPVCPIKFPMRKERTGNRRGPRFRLRPDKDRLYGAASATAGMISLAMSYREDERRRAAGVATAYNREFALLCHKIAKEQVRSAALWARRFSHRISDDDPRWAELERQRFQNLAALHATNT